MEVEEESFSAYSVRAKGVFNTFFYSTTQPLVQKSVGRGFRRNARAGRRGVVVVEEEEEEFIRIQRIL